MPDAFNVVLQAVLAIVVVVAVVVVVVAETVAFPTCNTIITDISSLAFTQTLLAFLLFSL
jgi:hypothetical protein